MVTRSTYDTWPLFKAFRESEQFRNSYKELFGEEFVVEKTAGDAEVPPAVDEDEVSEGEAEQGGEPEPPMTPDLETSSFGGGPVTAVARHKVAPD